MKRKNFITAAGAFLAGGWLKAAPVLHLRQNGDGVLAVPPPLKKGDCMTIVAGSGAITAAEMRPAIQQMESWGFAVRMGGSIGKKDGSFGGTDAERAADLQTALDDPHTAAIMLARGGYGLVRIIDALNFTTFRRRPKWVIGFSDATVLHSHLHTLGFASIHAKMTNSFPDVWESAEPIQRETILSIKEALSGRPMQYTALPHPQNKPGKVTGILTGGNLKILETLAGTASDINTAGKILFVEDTGEYLYSIDRMFWNLQRTGKLKNLAGLIVGGFRIKPDDPGEEFGRTLQQIVLEKTAVYNYPVCFDFPVGHQRANFALKCGVRHQLHVTPTGTTLLEKP